MRVEWTQLAQDRVFDIAAYISQDSLTEAKKWVGRIFDYVKRLEMFPESGRNIPELSGRKEIRELIFGNYRIIYRVEQDISYILTVRNYKQILPLNEIIKDN
ncbi:MAG TPA: plasmid stabilization protein [Lentisphaeria bacterium]|nr:MAG: hypothetical protein A2X47_02010 [Lentisphaerae bacterium GWF2_38_69]HBM16789.1 plasmid stabilization protein [Lentisphaeria bacterium]